MAPSDGSATSVALPKRGRPGYDQRSVLEVAVRTFNEHGYDATSMGALADALGISKSAIYHHVPSKSELLRLALDEALDGLEGLLDEPGAMAGTARARLEYVIRGAVRILAERLPFVTLLLRLRGNTEMERTAMARRRAFDRRVSALVEAARAEGSLRLDVDARVATRLLFGMINSIVEWYRPEGSESVDQLADDVITVALDGLNRVR